MSVKRILILSLAYYPRQIGGAEVAIKEITDRIGDVEFDMICLRFDSTLPRQEKIGNVTIHRIGWGTEKPSPKALRSFRYRLLKLWFQFAAAWHAGTLHKKNNYNALWAMMAHSCGVPGVLFKMRYPTVPFILTLQEGDPPAHIERVMFPLWPLFVRAFTKADMVQAISTYLGGWARKRGFTGPLEIIPNGVDVEKFSQEFPAAALNEIKDLLAKKMGDVFLITTSRLVHKNAVDDVLRAMPKMPQNVHFIILGTGPDETKLKKIASKLRIEERVRFVGEIGHDALPKYLKACDIFIRPSRSEGMGNSFVEAMAAGLPVIATQEGGISDFLFDQKRNPDKPITGWAVDKNAPGQIAVAVKDIMAQSEKVRSVVATARQMVAEKYDWNTVARSMRERVFDAVLKTDTLKP